ncbi:immunity 52 family protein [Burkholderia vietnamiensis]|nr:immunity 52 family protein [Burkholderia vietnamiensis]
MTHWKVPVRSKIPKARALIPVPADGRQIGTIVVSVTNAPFSVDNPEHVQAANSIEIRLVDRDLLPQYAHNGESRRDQPRRRLPARTTLLAEQRHPN